MPAPLDGIRVVEIGNYLAAPFASAQLADLGADVIKVENPDFGDFVRASGPFVNGDSSPFARLNRNKRSLALDIKSESGQETLTQLLGSTDILIENLRPGTLSKLGFGWEAVHAMNPRVVYISASGWGTEGPLAKLPGLDVMAQARSGLMSITGSPGGEPAKVGVPVCDLTAALYAALAGVAALQERERSGIGQHISVSLFEAGVSLSIWEAGQYFAGDPVHGPLGSAHQALAPYQAIRSSDGWFTVGATTPATWREFCKATGLDELVANPDYIEVESRFRNRERLIEQIEQATIKASKEHWVSVLSAAGVPCAPILTYDQVFEEDQLHQNDFFWEADHAVMGKVTQLGSAMTFSRTPTARRSSGPLLGEHTEEILQEIAGLGDGRDATGTGAGR